MNRSTVVKTRVFPSIVMLWSAGMQYRVASQAADKKQVPDHTHRIKNERSASAKVPKAVRGGAKMME